MKTWIVRFASLYVFNVVALLVIGWIVPGVNVGFFNALWASVILTALTIWVKPVFNRVFRTLADGTNAARRASAKTVEYIIVFAVALAIWVLLVLFSGVSVTGFFWGWIFGPAALLLVWAIYDGVDDRIEKKAGEVYDRATGTSTHAAPSSTASDSTSTAATDAGRRELRDGLTDEQRKMFDQL